MKKLSSIIRRGRSPAKIRSSPSMRVASQDRNRGSVRYSASPAAARTTAPISVDNVGWLDDSGAGVSTSDAPPPLSAVVAGGNGSSQKRRPAATAATTAEAAGEVLLTQGEVGGSLDTALDKSIRNVNIDQIYDVYKQLGTGRFGFVKLAEHKNTNKKIALKFFPRSQIKQADFLREYNYSRFLSPHPSIIDTFEGLFHSEEDCAFFFVQEFCPCASLRETVEASNGVGIGEATTKTIMLKVIAAIEFMHGEGLVHRNIKAENILLFDTMNYSRVKVTDFGLTRKVNATVKHLEYVTVYHAPELCETVVREALTVARSIDIWALGITVFYALKGRFPWTKAAIMCKQYWEWDQWLKHKLPQLPKQYDNFHDNALKLFKRCLNPRPKDRWSIKDLKKYFEKDRLLKAKSAAEETQRRQPRSFTPGRERRSNRQSRSSSATSKSPRRAASNIQKLIETTFNTMAEISEQVVSAADK